MESFNESFTYLPAHHIAICKTHRQGVLSSQLASHLDSGHQGLTVATRRAIASAVKALTDWAACPEEVVYPTSEAPPLSHLLLFEDGFRCRMEPCGHIVRGLQNIQNHCRREHGWNNPRKRGRPHQGAQQAPGSLMWTAGVCCQKFQPTGQLGRLFEVSQPRTQAVANKGGKLQCALESAFAQSTAAIAQWQQEAHAQIRTDDNRFVWHQWLQRTRWARHLAGFDRTWLQQQLCRPSRGEWALTKLCWAVEMVIWKAQQASSPEVVGLPAMTFVERRETGAADSERPFDALQTGKTMKKYSGHWVSAVCYIWRTYQLPHAPNNTERATDDASYDEAEGGGESTADNTSNSRPRYRLTAKQTYALWQIQQVLLTLQRSRGSSSSSDISDSDDHSAAELTEEKEEELQCCVLAFLVSLLDHQLGDDYYKSALVSATAVLGVDRDCGWKGPLVYTTTLSGFITVSKMLVLYSAVQARRKQIAELMSTEGWAQEDAEEQAESHVAQVQGMVARFMTLAAFGGAPTPIDWMLRLRAYGKKIRGDTNAAGVVQWVGDTIMHGYVQYSMPQLRSMIHSLVDTARLELYRELLLLDVDGYGQLADNATPLPAVEWDKIVDNPGELRAGWSFLQDPRNTFGGVKGDCWLSQRIIEEKRLREAFVDCKASDPSPGGCGVVWAAERVQQYKKALRLFREHLLVAAHMTGGQPARGTELVTVTYRNMPNGQSRGIFVEDGLMVYVTMYHKGIGHTGTAKVIHRYLPREVGELLFYYLWLVLPFWQKLERASGRVADAEPSPFIWEPIREERWTGPQRKKKQRLQQPSEAREHGEEESDAEEDGTRTGLEEKPVPVAVAAAGRTEQWGTNQIRRAIERVSLRWLKTKINIQIWRHNSKATMRQYIKDKRVLMTLGWGDDEPNQEAEDDHFDLQSGHGSRTAGQIYGRPADESPFSVQVQRLAFRRVSIAWHEFLQFNSTLSTPPKEGSTAAVARKEAVEEEYRRWKQMRNTDIQASLERLQGKGAQFRGCQKSVIEAIMRQESPVVAIIGTGMGKSLSFMLPALTSTGVTVVVVPILALKNDLKDRCIQAGIECVEWDSERPHEWASVVLVVPESAVSASFEAFINRQRAMGRLERIVVDECHIALESTKGWRTRVLKLRNLVKAETQLVYLTATLKPKEESEFIRLMALPPKEQCAWFRMPTTRPNIAYQVHWYNKGKEAEADVLTRLVQEKKEQYPLPCQIIVYCDSVARAKEYAATLGAVCYHREAGTAEEKRKLLRQLTEGQQQVFVATSALGLGVDHGLIRVVLFAGRVRRLRDLVQQSGRAGRDGARSESIIVRGGSYSPEGKRLAGGRYADTEAEVYEIVEGDCCIRVVLDREMDGNTARQGCERGEEACGWCQEQGANGVGGEEAVDEADRAEFQRSLLARRSLGRQEMALQSQEQLEVERLEEMLAEWKDGCQWCRVNEWAGAEQHRLADCRQEQSDDVREGAREMLKRVRWEKYSCCFTCGIPQSICASYRQRADAGWDKIAQAQCQYEGVLAASMTSIWVAAESLFSDWVQEQMRTEGVGQADEELQFDSVLAWMARLVWWGGIQSNRMCWVFVRFIARFARWEQKQLNEHYIY
jgi:superfamily II DNA or RNA helicase